MRLPLMFNAAWTHRNFIWTSIKSELSGRYARSKLGLAWMIIHPVAQVAVLALVLSRLIGARLPEIDSEYAYAIYLLAGVLAWNGFAETVGSAIQMFRVRASLIKKISFPKVCIPMIVAGSALITHFILSGVTLLLILSLGGEVSKLLLLLPILMLVNLMLAMAVGMILSIFDVFLRDVGNVWQVVVQFLFWLTPIVYMPSILPVSVRELLVFNPMYWLVTSYQNLLAFDTPPPISAVAIVAILAIAILCIAFFLFMRASSDIVDEL